MMAAAELVPITELIAACRDPKDNKFLELAVSGGADLIVSGDGDLRALTPSEVSRSSLRRRTIPFRRARRLRPARLIRAGDGSRAVARASSV